MFLNQTAHYALRAMTCLVLEEHSNPVNSAELSKRTDVPSHYLSKIMRKLVEAGYIISRKGHGGGFVVAKPLDQIRIIDVLNATGFDQDNQPCVFGWEKCSDAKPCPMHPVWKKLKESFNNWAFNTTMQDVKKENSLMIDNRFDSSGTRT